MSKTPIVCPNAELFTKLPPKGGTIFESAPMVAETEANNSEAKPAFVEEMDEGKKIDAPPWTISTLKRSQTTTSTWSKRR